MKKKTIWNLILNASLAALEITGLVLLFTLPLHLHNEEKVWDGAAFKFFTTDINVLLLVSSIATIICILLVYFKKIKQMPIWAKYLKLFTTACIAFVFIVVLLFLPLSEIACNTKPYAMFENSNAFYHLLCPICAIVDYLLFEDRSNIKFAHTYYGMIPTAVYAIFYLSMSLTHIQPGNTIPFKYDWYGLSNIGLSWTVFFTMLSIGATYLITWALWFGNKKIYIKQVER